MFIKAMRDMRCAIRDGRFAFSHSPLHRRWFVGCAALDSDDSTPHKPNPFYGFRVPKAFKNDAVWYEINAYSGKRLAVAGVGIAIAAIIFVVVPEMDVGVYVGIMSVILLLALGIGLIQSFLYLNRIAK